MIVFDTLFIILIIYLFIYCAYQLFFYVKARNIEKYFEMQEKTRSIVIEKRKLCVVIWATNKDKNLDKLLSVLNNQSYNKENYEVHVVYQKDENDTSISRDFALGARIHNIQNPDYFSKDKALNLFLQKMVGEDKFDAFVFLGANRMVGERYLENINKSLTSSCLLVGSKVCTNENPQLAKRIKESVINAYLKYVNRTNNIVRSIFELPFFVDGENFVITKDEKGYLLNVSDKNLYLYVNKNRVMQTYLKAGDVIFLNGLKIIWMMNYIVINNPNNMVKVSNMEAYNSNVGEDLKYQQIDTDEQSIELYSEDDYFFHKPRIKEIVEPSNIKIDLPPQKDESEGMPWYITALSIVAMLGMTFSMSWNLYLNVESGKTWKNL